MKKSIFTEAYHIGDIVRESWRLVRNHFLDLALILVLVFLPANAINFMANNLVEQFTSNPFALFGCKLIIIMLTGLIECFASVGIAILVERSLNTERITWINALRQALMRFSKVMGTYPLVFFAILISTLLLIIPGVIFSVYLSFTFFIIAVHGIHGKEALCYSYTMIRGSWWDVFSNIFTLGLFVRIISIPVFLAGELVKIYLPEWLWLKIFIGTMTDFVYGFFIIGLVLLFLNMDYLLHPAEVSNTEDLPEKAY